MDCRGSVHWIAAATRKEIAALSEQVSVLKAQRAVRDNTINSTIALINARIKQRNTPSPVLLKILANLKNSKQEMLADSHPFKPIHPLVGVPLPTLTPILRGGKAELVITNHSDDNIVVDNGQGFGRHVYSKSRCKIPIIVGVECTLNFIGGASESFTPDVRDGEVRTNPLFTLEIDIPINDIMHRKDFQISAISERNDDDSIKMYRFVDYHIHTPIGEVIVMITNHTNYYIRVTGEKYSVNDTNFTIEEYLIPGKTTIQTPGSLGTQYYVISGEGVKERDLHKSYMTSFTLKKGKRHFYNSDLHGSFRQIRPQLLEDYVFIDLISKENTIDGSGTPILCEENEFGEIMSAYQLFNPPVSFHTNIWRHIGMKRPMDHIMMIND